MSTAWIVLVAGRAAHEELAHLARAPMLLLVLGARIRRSTGAGS